jgi:membrane protein
MLKVHKFLYRHLPFYQSLINWLRNIVLPGFEGVPLWYVLRFFIIQLNNEVVTLRASAVAFNSFLALVPSLIFLFTLIPYFPIDNLEEQAMLFLESYMPDQAFATIEGTVRDILVQQRTGLLSLGFLFSIYFATNGVYSLLDAFNQGNSRPFAKKWLAAFGLMLSTVVVLLMGISLYIFFELTISQILKSKFINFPPGYYLYQILSLMLIFGIIYINISIVYFFGPSKRIFRPPLFSPGSIVATILMMSTGYAFAFYVNNFSQYNKFYGSLGALIILMIWLYINAIVLIIGFEINQSINMAKNFRYNNKRKIFNNQITSSANTERSNPEDA